MKPSLAQLAQFAAVVEHGSFTRASAALSVAQPWLSTSIRVLEATVGFRLLDRSPQGISLTADGTRYYAAVRRLLRRAAELSELAETIATAADNLRLGAIPDSFYIPERNLLLDRFRTAYPGVILKLENHADPELRRLLLDGQLDAAFITGSPPRGCEAVLIRTGRAELLLPPGHVLRCFHEVPLGAVAGVKVAVFRRDQNPVAWDETAGRLASAGAILVTLPESLRVASVAQALREQMALLALTSFDDSDPGYSGMEARRMADPTIGADFYLVRRRQRDPRRPLDRLWTCAQQANAPK